jgi:L-fuconolactonase
MTVLDAQVHIWAPERPDRPWIPGGAALAHRPSPITADNLLADMDATGVDRVLVVSPSWEGVRNDVVLDAARQRPDRFGAVFRFAPDDTAAAARFAGWAADPVVHSARVLFHRDSATHLTDGTADWMWPELERAGLPVMVFAPGQYEPVGAVAKDHPDLKMTVCHMGFNPALRDEAALSTVDDLMRLSALPNVSVKATSLPSFVTEPYPFPTLQALVRRTIGEFGSERVFWGSDLSRLSCSYAELYRFAREELDVSDAERADLLGDAAATWYGWAP